MARLQLKRPPLLLDPCPSPLPGPPLSSSSPPVITRRPQSVSLHSELTSPSSAHKPSSVAPRRPWTGLPPSAWRLRPFGIPLPKQTWDGPGSSARGPPLCVVGLPLILSRRRPPIVGPADGDVSGCLCGAGLGSAPTPLLADSGGSGVFPLRFSFPSLKPDKRGRPHRVCKEHLRVTAGDSKGWLLIPPHFTYGCRCPSLSPKHSSPLGTGCSPVKGS